MLIGETNKTRYLHIPELNPVEYLYYTLIDSGALGFQRIKDYKIYPHIGLWEINDDAAELSFHFFDHPRVTIYRKTDKNIPIKTVLFQELLARFPNANF